MNASLQLRYNKWRTLFTVNIGFLVDLFTSVERLGFI